MQFELKARPGASEALMKGQGFEFNLETQRIALEVLSIQGKSHLEINPNTPEGQLELRVYYGFLWEELMELYEALYLHNEDLRSRQYDWSIKDLDTCYEISQELADANKLILNFLIWLGGDETDIWAVLNDFAAVHNLKAAILEDNLLQSIYNICQSSSSLFGLSIPKSQYLEIDLEEYYPMKDYHLVFSIGTKASDSLIEEYYPRFLFNYQSNWYNILKTLKKKPWRVSGPDIDENELKYKVASIVVEFYQLAFLLGAKPTSLFYFLEHKTEIHLEKITKPDY